MGHIAQPAVNYVAAKTACEVIGDNIHLASIISKDENDAVKGIEESIGRKCPDSNEECWDTWLNGYYDDETAAYYWTFGEKDTDEKFDYTPWKADTDYPTNDPTRMVRIDTVTGDWKDKDRTDSYSVMCMMRCNANYWKDE